MCDSEENHHGFGTKSEFRGGREVMALDWGNEEISVYFSNVNSFRSLLLNHLPIVSHFECFLLKSIASSATNNANIVFSMT